MPTTTPLQVDFRTVAGVRIRYADSGSSREPAVLLTSPWPESVYAFAAIWDSLAEHARLFAIDLPGFGTSEDRDDLFSPRAMGEFSRRSPKVSSASEGISRSTRLRHVAPHVFASARRCEMSQAQPSQ